MFERGRVFLLLGKLLRVFALLLLIADQRPRAEPIRGYRCRGLFGSKGIVKRFHVQVSRAGAFWSAPCPQARERRACSVSPTCWS